MVRIYSRAREKSAISSCCPSPNPTFEPDTELSSGDERIRELDAKVREKNIATLDSPVNLPSVPDGQAKSVVGRAANAQWK
jgi:hypothetical protein